MKCFLQLGVLLAATFAVAQAPSSFQDKSTQPAAQVTPADLSNVGIDQRLNQQVPLDLQFKDETGKTVKLGDYFQAGRPVILNLVYYTCPMLCGEELVGEASALSVLKFTPGNEYEVVSVSFNPDETPKDAAEAKQTYIARINEHLQHKTNGDGWHFLTGQQSEIKQLGDAVGFRYHRDPASGQFIHATAIMIVTPTGKLAQYYYGVEYSPKDIRLGLIEASRDKIGTVVDEVVLYCYHYDPKTGRYGAVVTNIMRLAGAATMLILGGFLIVMFRRDAHGSKKGNRTGLIDMWKNLPLFPERASALAWQVDGLYFLLIAVSAFFTLLIFVMIFVFAVKYRRSVHPHPVQIEGSLPLELAWTLIPLGICMIFFAWGSLIYFQEARPPRGAMEVYVVGKQWMWKFEHESGQREINQLHVPLGADVKMVMSSQDVIHSFFVPAFRIKADVLPGRFTTTWFHTTKVGTYHLFCSQYCGTDHSGMIGQVIVMDPVAYQAWVAGNGGSGGLTTSGQQLYQQLGCATCHRSDTQGRGPNLAGLYGRQVMLEDGRTVVADENYIRESIVNPGAKIVAGFKPIMPTFQGQISEESLMALVAYIKSLSPSQSTTANNQASGGQTTNSQ